MRLFFSQHFCRRTVLFGTALAAILSLTGCDETGVFTPLGIKSFSCNKLRAVPDETLTLRWEYQGDTPIKAQRLRFLRLHLFGIAQELVDVPVDALSFEFKFNGALTVELQSTYSEVTTENPFQVQRSASLSVLRLQDMFFRGQFSSLSATLDAPFLGQSGNNANELVSLEFQQFVGFFDTNNNGTIDPLAGIRPNFDEDDFRGLSKSEPADPIPSGSRFHLSFREGPHFPFQIRGNLGVGRSNAIIFAGTIVSNGPTKTYKADDGEGQTHITPPNVPMGFDALFVAIPFLDAAEQTITDIQIGTISNLPGGALQGLVTNVTSTPLLVDTRGLGTINQFSADRSARIARGSIKGAVTGLAMTPVNGGPFVALVGANTIEWQVEFIPDTDLLTVISTGL
jgi:hypothetical protein